MEEKEKFIPLQKCSFSMGKIIEMVGVLGSAITKDWHIVCMCVYVCNNIHSFSQAACTQKFVQFKLTM